jgi:hypothetical protein
MRAEAECADDRPERSKDEKIDDFAQHIRLNTFDRRYELVICCQQNLRTCTSFFCSDLIRIPERDRQTEREKTNGKEGSETEDQKGAGSQSREEVDRAQDRSQDGAQGRQKAGKESTAGCLRQPGYARRISLSAWRGRQ